MAQELEFKVMTDRAEFDRCLARLRAHTGQSGETYVQVNYYFDSPAFDLSRSHAMLRVRRKKNSLSLQYKNKRKRIGSMLLCDESEAELGEFPRSVDPSRYFPSAPSLECTLLGDLVTNRTDFAMDGAVVSFDENFYLGKVDFEIEIEGEESSIVALVGLLSPVGESKKGNGKFSRFLNEFRKYHN